MWFHRHQLNRAQRIFRPLVKIHTLDGLPEDQSPVTKPDLQKPETADILKHLSCLFTYSPSK